MLTTTVAPICMVKKSSQSSRLDALTNCLALPETTREDKESHVRIQRIAGVDRSPHGIRESAREKSGAGTITAALFQFLKQLFAFPWGKKAIRLDTVLAGVEIVIAALESV